MKSIAKEICQLVNLSTGQWEEQKSGNRKVEIGDWRLEISDRLAEIIFVVNTRSENEDPG
jgi:hypothetical protein